jgi:hypothetical protein
MFDEDLRLEVEPGAEAKHFVPGARIAIGTAAVRVDTEAKANVGAVIASKNRFGTVWHQRGGHGARRVALDIAMVEVIDFDLVVG